MLRTILTALALTVALGVTASIAGADSIGGAPASGGYWYGNVFKSPTGNLVCKYAPSSDSVTCGRRNDQRVVFLAAYDRPARDGYRMTFSEYGVHTLYYGQQYHGAGRNIECQSNFDGMRCENSTRHGFFISRTAWERW
jgi:hypothetical protein